MIYKINKIKVKNQAIIELLKLNISNRAELILEKRKISKRYNIPILQNSDIIEEYRKLLRDNKISPRPELERIIRKRAIRTMSGIAPVAVLTKPYPCPGECVYCPTEPGVPQSYLSNEPAVMRAIRCGYDPYIQVQDRLKALIANGHKPTKIELIIIGGTWSCLPRKYKYWYIANCFKAANDFKTVILRPQAEESRKATEAHIKTGSFASLRMTLIKQQKINEKARYKIIGITVETRPDYIKEKEIWQMRELGVTRVELGVQAVDDKILKLNNRGHGVQAITDATKLLKNYGFKVTYHIMPGLPGSTPAKDLKMFETLFTDEQFQPDQIKFYPTVVTKGSLLYRWWKAGKYKPYSNKQLQNLIIKCKAVVPKYVRIIRLIRDIPGESIIAGNTITNLRQVMQDKGVKCNCIRCREAREREFKVQSLKLKVIKYKASGGQEQFLSYESKDGNTLYGFCRLRLPDSELSSGYPELSSGTAIIRELHVYGELVPVGSDLSASSGRKRKVQHAGLGKRLLREAERNAKMKGFRKIAIISGVGVRDYYRKMGYRLQKTYMVKSLI